MTLQLLTAAFVSAMFLAQAGADSPTLSGRLVAPDGHPVPKATVRIVELKMQTSTDDDGRFKFEAVPTGALELVADCPGFRTNVAKVHYVAEQGMMVDMQMSANQQLHDYVVVTATGTPEPMTVLSRSVGVVDQAELQRNRTVGLDESLNQIPGVKAESQNDTQEVRISIRGRGENTSFGNRSIKILVDGIPENDATGETADFSAIDPGAMERIEVVKGPMSSLYGSSANGVINLITPVGTREMELQTMNLFGSFGFNKQEDRLSGSLGSKLFYSLDGSHTHVGGYRQHSKDADNRFTGRVDYSPFSRTQISFFGRVGDLESQLPGNLTRQQWLADPTQAGPSWLFFNAQSNITRINGALVVNQELTADQSLSGSFYGRSLEYELPEPGIFITGLRYEQGGNLRYTNRKNVFGRPNILQIGADLEHETELRQDHNNQGGNPGTAFLRHEHRRALDRSYHIFEQIQPTSKLVFSAGFNYSQVSVRFLNYLANGLISGPEFSQASYQAGATYRWSARVSTYANLATGFEPPSVTELGRDPNGGAGLNLGLRPQTSLSGEIGALVRLRDRLMLDVAAYRARVQNEIVPTGIGGNQTAYTNAAEVMHNGGEVGLTAMVRRGIDVHIAYTVSDFYYTQYLNQLGNFSGHWFPGIPRNRVYGQVNYSNRYGLFGSWTTSYVESYFVNDANTATNDPYSVTNVRAGYMKDVERFRVSFLIGVNNLFSRNYVAYNVINDSGGAYYYPMAPRYYTGTASLTWTLRRAGK